MSIVLVNLNRLKYLATPENTTAEVMMYNLIIKTMLLAAFSDGKVQPTEIALIKTLRDYNENYKSVSETEIKNLIADIGKKLKSGFEERVAVGFILDEISRTLTQSNRNCAYALAAEICASNHLVLPAENDFLALAREKLEITEDIITVVHQSIALRYGEISHTPE
jgi:hypothetical protein